MFCNEQMRLHCGLPFFGIVFCLGQLGDVERGVAERDPRLSARQHDWIEEPLIPRHGRPKSRAPDRSEARDRAGGTSARDGLWVAYWHRWRGCQTLTMSEISPLTGHVADLPKLMRMTHFRLQADRAASLVGVRNAAELVRRVLNDSL